jgi:tetratricopeptide (TPR) repeat protein
MTTNGLRAVGTILAVSLLLCGQRSLCPRETPGNDEAHQADSLQRCKRYLEANDYRRVIEEATTALVIDPRNAEWYLMRGRAYAGQLKYEQALDDFERCIKLNPSHSEGYFLCAEALLSQGNPDEALAAINKAIERQPLEAEYHYLRGRVYQALGSVELAKEQYQRAISLNPKYLKACHGKAMLHCENGEYGAALDYATKAIEIAPDSAESYAIRSYIYNRDWEYKEAIEDITKAIDRDSNNPRYYYSRAWSEERIELYADAVRDLEKVLALDERDNDAAYALARLLATCPNEKIRDGKRAVELASRACERSAWRAAWYIDTLAAAYAEQGRFRLAAHYARKAMDVSDDQREEALFGRHLELYQKQQPCREAKGTTNPPESESPASLPPRRQEIDDADLAPMPRVYHNGPVEGHVEAPMTQAAFGGPQPSLQGTAPGKVGRLLEALGYTDIPLEQLKTGHLVAEVSAKGKKLRLVIDTGSAGSFLDKERTEHLKLTWQRADSFPRDEESNPQFDYYTAAEVSGLDFGSFMTRRMRVYAADLNPFNRLFKKNGDRPVDGLLGADFLGKYKVLIDYPTLRLYLKQPPGWFFLR